MTLDKARELIDVQVSFGGGYNRNATKIILAEVHREHGQEAVDMMIREFGLDELWQIKIGTSFEGQSKF